MMEFAPGNSLGKFQAKNFQIFIKVFVRGMEPKGIFPTVTLDIDTWNQERDKIVQKLENVNSAL